MSTEQSFIVTVVHGTFVRDAEWAQEGSPLIAAIRHALGDNAHIVRFRWSGRNSNSARMLAATELRAHLQREEYGRPSARHVLFAHSHGGNVVMYALAEPELRSRVAGVITMSTPFILARPRGLGPNDGRAILSLLGLPTLAATLLANRLLHLQGLWKWLPALIAGVVGGMIMLWGERYLKQRRKQMAGMVLPEMPDLRALLLRIVGDEASIGLVAAQFSVWFSNRLWRMLSFPLEWLDHAMYGRGTRSSALVQRAYWHLIIYLILMLLLIAGTKAAFGTYPKLWGQITGWGTLILNYLAIGSLWALALLGVPLAIVLAISSPFTLLAGLGGPATTLLYEVSIESTPVGKWSVVQFPEPDAVATGFDLNAGDSGAPQWGPWVPRHLGLYTDPRALQCIEQWLQSLTVNTPPDDAIPFGAA